MKRALIFALILGIPATVTAADYSCNFDQECYDSESCADSDFNVEVRGSDEKIATDFGTFPILALRDEPGVLTVFVTSEGAVYLLSASDTAARFTAHITDGPQSVTYLGNCEKVG